ncbi:hypothetical protein HAX54_008380, partial [Datura stramonium]|nr:hypothetical protein [Datura stramonium]
FKYKKKGSLANGGGATINFSKEEDLGPVYQQDQRSANQHRLSYGLNTNYEQILQRLNQSNLNSGKVVTINDVSASLANME